MKTNVQITATPKELKNVQNGFEVKVKGLDGKLDVEKTFSNPQSAMRYMLLISEKCQWQINSIDILALSIAYQDVKDAEQKVATSEMQNVISAGEEAEQDSEEPAPVESVDTNEVDTSLSLIQQYNELKAKHPDALLLFRCGDFYETYKEDAQNCAKILGITLTKRSSDKLEMAGFPYHALDTYLPKLIRTGKRVAICDQIEDAKRRGRKRKITELVTPSATQQELKLEVAV